MPLAVRLASGDPPRSPVPGPEAIEVHERIGRPTHFRLRYPARTEGGDIPLLAEEQLAPGTPIQISVPDREEVLVFGPVRGHRIALEEGGAESTFDVIGADRCIEMDREARSAVWDKATDSQIVSSVVKKYPKMVDDVAPSRSRHGQEKHTLVQRESDLSLVQRLARRNGCYFWLTSVLDGTVTAHFQPPKLTGAEPVALPLFGTPPVLSALRIDLDVECPTSVEARQLNLNDKQVLRGDLRASPLRLLGSEGLATIAKGVRSRQLSAPADDATALQSRSKGALLEASWFIQARAETSLKALGRVVRCHQLVDLQGAGTRHSGTYYVAGVRHRIDSAQYRMEVELVRNAWGASA